MESETKEQNGVYTFGTNNIEMQRKADSRDTKHFTNLDIPLQNQIQQQTKWSLKF